MVAAQLDLGKPFIFEIPNILNEVEPDVVLKPRTGAGLFFQHPIIHEGATVTSGIKYAVRTDLMYKRQAT